MCSLHRTVIHLVLVGLFISVHPLKEKFNGVNFPFIADIVLLFLFSHLFTHFTFVKSFV